MRAFDKDSYKAGPAFSISRNLTLEQDAAHVNLGGNWRMPTRAEYHELLNNCKVVWTDDYNGTGIKGHIFTSKVNGNSLFFPAAGACNPSSVDDVGSYGFYWSSTYVSRSSAYYLHFYSGHIDTNINDRNCGKSVRGVFK